MGGSSLDPHGSCGNYHTIQTVFCDRPGLGGLRVRRAMRARASTAPREAPSLKNAFSESLSELAHSESDRGEFSRGIEPRGVSPGPPIKILETLPLGVPGSLIVI